ncbi:MULTISPECIES: GNAT family N-acetyltransferase [unclassified Caballeronia]|uniref:GNAT family N-acetyltransferase n=1 Tax=unclassified Caballeronia TaxID=2646786 RepID=UPI002864316B|nr:MULTISPECIES: GNAT family N-acetyltransferase [unclassified Caballeronia]MDR5753647.1 GNAT family N-acetyltransferase [Caballeronia sp. LZ024]MDR5840026.1 GNAT family N-acetyltransferase [Caballeronia sp. LZ031]
MIEVRPYRPSDLDAIIDLFLRSVREVAARDYDRWQVDAWAQADRDEWSVKRMSRPTWVAMSGTSLAGFADLESDGHLDMMFVHPAHQGAGVASALLAQVEASARERGIARLHAEASITARPFFERRGFRVIAAQVVHVRGADFKNFRMEKTLSPSRTAR